jgi:tetratricopeptide (TPR) repeat protein
MSDRLMSPELRKVEALLAMGKPAEAALLAERLPARESPTPEYLRVRGRAFRAAGRAVDAELSFREALSLSPGEPGIAADLATTLVAQHRHKDALPFAREAVSLRPSVAAYHALLGFIAERLEYTSEARQALETARELAPGDAETHTVLGFHLLRVGDAARAVEVFEAAIGADPRRAEAFHGLAKAQAGAGRWQPARTAWAEALSIDPSQRDRALERKIRLLHPALRPVHRVAAVPPVFSLVLALVAGALLWLGRSGTGFGAPFAVPASAFTLLLIASLSPGARRLIGAIDG